jgi:hypothetical protein
MKVLSIIASPAIGDPPSRQRKIVMKLGALISTIAAENDDWVKAQSNHMRTLWETRYFWMAADTPYHVIASRRVTCEHLR